MPQESSENAKKLNLIRLEYGLVAALVSIISLLFGFGLAALIFAEQAYPELNANLITAIHHKLFSAIFITALIYTPLLAVLFAFFSIRQVKRVEEALMDKNVF
ncbi:MAG: hypothetical protein HY746_08280 [Elusimicrobia bacterium]|nr:hypothetical protein [Elusimicrobiota bacterium]